MGIVFIYRYTMRSRFADVHRHQNVLWNEFPNWARMKPTHARVTQPKPDLTYGFPVVSLTDRLYQTSAGDYQVDSFSLPVLGELRTREKGWIVSTPTTALANWMTKKNSQIPTGQDLMCFPWAIVEIKKGIAEPITNDARMNTKAAQAHERRTQFCYCQAANASAAGVLLREQLAKRGRDRSHLQNARVMFSFTCVGSTVKLWITYRQKPVSPLLCHRELSSDVRSRTNAPEMINYHPKGVV